MRRSTLALFIAPAFFTAVQAAAGVSTPTQHPHAMNPSTAACEAARLASWFEAQRQLTDGDADPAKPIATPDECTQSDGRANATIERMNAHAAPMPAAALVESRG